jgi:transcription initiation factor TFIID subunit 7
MDAPQESHFILRLPERLAKRLRDALEASAWDTVEDATTSVGGRRTVAATAVDSVDQGFSSAGNSLAADNTGQASSRQLLASTKTEQFWLVFFPENRNGRLAALRIGNETQYEEHFGFMFDLPCIVESWKTLDGRTVYKCADVHQILQIYEDPKDLPTGTEETLGDGLTPASRGFLERHRPEEPKYSAIEVAQHEEIIKYALDFRKPWNGPMPVSVDVDEEVVEEEIWVPLPKEEMPKPPEASVITQASASVANMEKLPNETPLEAAPVSLPTETDQLASELEEALLQDSEPATTEERPSATAVSAARQAEQARKDLLRRNLEQRIAELEREISRIANPLLRSRVQRRLEQTKAELDQLNAAD